MSNDKCPAGYPVAVEGGGWSEIWKGYCTEEGPGRKSALLRKEVRHFCPFEYTQCEKPGQVISEH